MSESLSKILMIIVTIVLVVIATIALIGILNSSSDKSTQQTNKFNPHRLNVFVVSPPQGGHVKFYPVVDDNHQKIGYVSSFIMYTDKPLHNNTMYLKVLNVPPDKIYVEPLGNETYSDGKVTYHYKYNVTVFYDKDTFDRLYNDNKNDYVYVSIGSGTISSLNYGEIEIENINVSYDELENNNIKLKYPEIIIGLDSDNYGNVVFDKVIVINNSNDKPTLYVIYEPSVLNDSRVDLNNTNVIIGTNTFNSSKKVFYNGYEYTSDEPVNDLGDLTNVTIVNVTNNNSIFSGNNVPTVEYQSHDTNNDGLVDTILLYPDYSNITFYIDSGLELHYTIFNYGTKYPVNIQSIDNNTDSNMTNDRWVSVMIYDYSGNTRDEAENNYLHNNVTLIINPEYLNGRFTTEKTLYCDPISNNGNIIGFNIKPQGYIKEMLDLSTWLNDNRYHIIRVVLFVNGHLWNVNSNNYSSQTYQLVYDKVFEINNTGGVTLYNSSLIWAKVNETYISFFVTNPFKLTFTLWNKTTNTTDITTTIYLREGNTTRGTDPPIITLINNLLGIPYPSDSSLDEALYVNKNDNYENITKQDNISMEILESEGTLVIKILSELVDYGIYDIQITGKDSLTFVNKYFLWDGNDIWWLDFDKNIGHYYPDFSYKKPYNITDYHGNILFGEVVLTYIVFTNDTFSGSHYIENVPINESQVAIDLNNDGDMIDVINETVFDSTMYHSLLDNINGNPVWKTKYVGIRFTYIENGIGEAEIPFYIDNVTKGQNKITVNGKQEDIWVAKVWVKIPVIRDSSTGDLNNGYLYWYGEPYNLYGS